MGRYDLPRRQEGGVTSQLCAIYLDDNWLRDPFRRGMEMVWNLHDQVARNDGLVLGRQVIERVNQLRIVIDLVHIGEVGFGEILEDIAAVPRLTDALAARGHSDEVILKFLGANYLRVFETVWGE